MLRTYETLENTSDLPRRRGLRLASFALTAVLATAGAASLAVTPIAVAPVAHATAIKPVAKASEFDPGNIVSNAVFFDGAALSAAQVQAFLKARVPKCNKSASGPTCLRDYKQSTPSIAADAYCKKYAGSSNESAARIIYKVGKACGVSQKALLVLLEKEQSLVTSGSTTLNMPTDYKYLHATGFACPDTAPCDPKYSGIFYQLYYGARQYQRYAKDPFFSWRSIGKNNIGYNPKASCGSATVNVQNQATLGLYYYTPYVPNAAALEHMYSTGDSCSSYGNRNFFRIFNDWFGSTQRPVRGAIQKVWIANSSHAGKYGRPSTVPKCNATGTYCVQRFAGGYLASRSATGFALANTAFVTKWVATGSTAGTLGWPYSKAACNSKGCRQRFTGGELAAKPGKALRIVPAKIATAWRAKKHVNGALGAPIKKRGRQVDPHSSALRGRIHRDPEERQGAPRPPITRNRVGKGFGS